MGIVMRENLVERVTARKRLMRRACSSRASGRLSRGIGQFGCAFTVSPLMKLHGARWSREVVVLINSGST